MTGVLQRRAVLMAGIAGALARSVNSVHAAEAAAAGPFGLVWGASPDEVRRSGVTLAPVEGRSDYGKAYSATGLSRVLSDMAGAVLAFGHNDTLWRVAAFGRPVGPDPTGGQLVARYMDLAEALAGRYGPGRETDSRDREMWKGPSEYVMSLKMGRAHRYTVFLGEAVGVELSIRGTDSDTGNYLIIYEHLPGARKFELDKKKAEKDAL